MEFEAFLFEIDSLLVLIPPRNQKPSMLTTNNFNIWHNENIDEKKLVDICNTIHIIVMAKLAGSLFFWVYSQCFAILMIIGSREIDVYPFNENSLFVSVTQMYIRRFKVNSIVRCQQFHLNIQLDAIVAIIVDSAVRLHEDSFFFCYLFICHLLWRVWVAFIGKSIYVTGVKKGKYEA